MTVEPLLDYGSSTWGPAGAESGCAGQPPEKTAPQWDSEGSVLPRLGAEGWLWSWCPRGGGERGSQCALALTCALLLPDLVWARWGQCDQLLGVVIVRAVEGMKVAPATQGCGCAV